jgi:hypothetical protein
MPRRPGYCQPDHRLGSRPRNALAQASGVAPVVITSSISNTRRLSTCVPGRVAKAARNGQRPDDQVRLVVAAFPLALPV